MAENKVTKGSLSIESENIFPIIKKWLYSDQDIFIREMISNGCDAITKLRKLEVMGEYRFPEDTKLEIQVVANPTAKTLKFIDNGIGMTADEVVERYEKMVNTEKQIAQERNNSAVAWEALALCVKNKVAATASQITELLSSGQAKTAEDVVNILKQQAKDARKEEALAAQAAKQQALIEYLAMMADIDIDDDEENNINE